VLAAADFFFPFFSLYTGAREEVEGMGDEDGEEDARAARSGGGRDVCKMFFDLVVTHE